MRRLRLVPDVTNIDFMRYTRLWVAISILGIVASIVLVLTRGLNYGVDFRGGMVIVATTPEAHDMASFRETLSALDFGEVNVTEISDDSGQGRFTVLMRLGISDPDANAMDVVETVRAALTQTFPGIQFLQVDSVGSKVSGELIWKGVLAVVLAFLGIMVYIWLRFEWQFAIGSVLSLIHDAIVTVGLFSLLQIEFNLTIVAAVLTVIGYSINDTVVIFDRVRELLRKYKKTPLPELMNMALNETLSRTVMTTTTTLLALFAIYFFGGDVLRGFALAMIFGGVIVGTYSSMYVACATVLWLGVRRDWSAEAAAAAAPAKS
jgi:preprotein translocase SecF subunit